MSNIDYEPTTGQVHRLGNRVAVFTGKGCRTVYMTASEADAFADALRSCAQNIREGEHPPQYFGTRTLPIAGREP